MVAQELSADREMVRQTFTPNLKTKRHACELVPKGLSERQTLARRQVYYGL